MLQTPMPLQQALPLFGLHVPVHSSSGSVLDEMKSHTPLVPPVLSAAQDSHVPEHTWSQQNLVPVPSVGQKPLRHALALVHGWPFTSLHALLPSHAWVALQPPYCPPAGTLVHVPTLPATSHRAQSPLQGLLQHTPSWQMLLRQ